MKNLKYLYISLGVLAFTACNDPEDVEKIVQKYEIYDDIFKTSDSEKSKMD